MGYLERAKKDLIKSSEYLSQAESLAKKEHQSSDIALEIYLNQAFNAYLQDLPKALPVALQKARDIDENNLWVFFFTGIDSFQQDKCSDALDDWKMSKNRKPLSLWMRKAFNEVFTPLWVNLHTTRCEIEEGNYQSARQKLIQETQNAVNATLPEINFLIGLTYAKEAQEKPAAASLPYYKLAFSYFNRVPMLESQYAADRKKIIDQILNQVKSLIQTQNFNDITYFLTILDNWNAREETKEISTMLVNLLNHEIETNQLEHVQELTGILNRMLPPGEIRNSLGKRFGELLTNAIKEEHFDEMTLYWDAEQLFSPDIQGQKKLAISQISSQVLDKIPDEDPDLKTVTRYLAFWNQLQPDSKERASFATKLMDIDTILWAKEESKASKLLLMTRSIISQDQQNQFLTSAQSLLQKLYAEALQKEDIEQTQMDLPNDLES